MIGLIIISILISIRNVKTLVPIGGNLDILICMSRSQPYVNLIKQSCPWGNISDPWQSIPTADPKTGWPTSDFAVVISASAVDTGGTYLFYAKGNANVSVLGEYFAYITNKTYDTTTNTISSYTYSTRC
jgi:hypothetical protein